MKYSVKQARRLAGLTQLEMAEILGISRSNYIDYELYRLSFRIDQAYKFTKAVGLNFNDIAFQKHEINKRGWLT